MGNKLQFSLKEKNLTLINRYSYRKFVDRFPKRTKTYYGSQCVISCQLYYATTLWML